MLYSVQVTVKLKFKVHDISVAKFTLVLRDPTASKTIIITILRR